MNCEKCNCEMAQAATDGPALCNDCNDKALADLKRQPGGQPTPFKKIIVKNLITSFITGLVISSGVNIYSFVFKHQGDIAEAGGYLGDTLLLQTPKSGIFYLLWAIVLLVFFLRGVLRALYQGSLRGAGH